MYKAILLNTRGEIVDYKICETYHTAVKQCLEWQLEHEYDYYETEIKKF